MEKSSFEPRYKYNLGRLKMGFERIYMFDNRDILYQQSCKPKSCTPKIMYSKNHVCQKPYIPKKHYQKSKNMF